MRPVVLLTLLFPTLLLAGPAPAGELVPGQGDPLVYEHCRWVPTAARTPRLNQYNWVTDVEVVNTGELPAALSVALLARDQDNRSSALATLDQPLSAGAAARLDDVVTSVVRPFWRPWLGGLVVCSDRPDLEVWSRVSLVGPEGEGAVGLGVPGLALAEAVRPGVVGHLAGLREDAEHRSHLGLVNPTPTPVEVKVRLLAEDGRTLLVLVHDLLPHSQVQLNRVLARGRVDSGRAEVTTATGPVFAYGVVVDNSSEDPAYVPCQLVAD